MKKGIHPQVNTQAVVTCACGNTFTTHSTMDNVKVDICSACHPFYTGQRRFVDTEKRIDKFARKMELANAKKEEVQSKKNEKEAKKVKQQQVAGKTVKELMEQLKNEQKAENKG